MHNVIGLLNGLGIVLVFGTIGYLLWVTYVLLHELGHAVMALLLTKGPVALYIGSYGKGPIYLRLQCWRLSLYLRRNPLRWGRGYVQHAPEGVSLVRQIAIRAAGPLAPLILTAVGCWLVLVLDAYPAIKWPMFILGFWSLTSAFQNLRPRSRPVRIGDGLTVYNDGTQILSLIRYRSIRDVITAKWSAAFKHFNAGEYESGFALLEEILQLDDRLADVYRTAIYWCHVIGDHQRAFELNARYEESGILNAADLVVAGTIKARLGYFDDGIADFARALELDPNVPDANNNRGYSLILLERYAEAIADFDRAIELNDGPSYAHANRGLARIKLGMTADGLDDINHAIELDNANGYAYRNVGIHHSDCGDFATALQLFVKAREVASDTHMVEEWIVRAAEEVVRRGGRFDPALPSDAASAAGAQAADAAPSQDAA